MDHRKRINHLYWRAGFGLNPSEFVNYNKSIEENVHHLFAKAENVSTIDTHESTLVTKAMMDKEERRKKAIESVQNVKNDWLLRMTKPEHSALLERMCLFWHGHFACRIVLGGKIAANYLKILRSNALGSFRSLVLGIAKDPAMIRYLNNQQNKKDQPNENFARELMELFTLGRGHYSENDIKEAARAFTGWSSNFMGDFVFRKRQHDFGKKLFKGRKGHFDGEDIIDIILEDKQTARFITEKIYRYFVNDEIDHNKVEELSNWFYNNDYHIGGLMKQIFLADWFYDSRNIGNKIKSPVELIAGLTRSLNLKLANPMALIAIQRQLGQILLNPPNVAGWPGGKSWIDNATLLTRLNLSFFIFGSAGIIQQGEMKFLRKRFEKLDLSLNTSPIFNQIARTPKSRWIEELASYFINGDHPDKKDVEYGIRLKKKQEYFDHTLMRLLATPEYQMC